MSNVENLMMDIYNCNNHECRECNCHAFEEYQRKNTKGYYFFQKPEPWNGNIETAKIMFLSSNPSIDLHDNKKDEIEVYPGDRTKKWTDEEICNYFRNRFVTGKQVYRKDDANIPPTLMNRNVKYWSNSVYWIVSILKTLFGQEIISDKDFKNNKMQILNDYVVMTEIVHCKSRDETNVEETKDICAEKYLNRILDLFNGKIIILVGAKVLKKFYNLENHEEIERNLKEKKIYIIEVPHPDYRGNSHEFIDKIIEAQLVENSVGRAEMNKDGKIHSSTGKTFSTNRQYNQADYDEIREWFEQNIKYDTSSSF